MRIDWAPNPLQTRVFLTDEEKERLRLKAHLERLEQHLSVIKQRLDPESRLYDVDAARRMAAYSAWDSDEGVFAELVEGVYQDALVELESGAAHCGDCTCQPASCMKCWAEELAGVDTIKGCGKHGLYKIDGAFRAAEGEPPVTLDQAIVSLESYDPKATWPGWEAHVPRWKAEAAGALKWLRAYRDEHFPVDKT